MEATNSERMRPYVLARREDSALFAAMSEIRGRQQSAADKPETINYGRHRPTTVWPLAFSELRPQSETTTITHDQAQES